ncbi:MAG: L-lysine 6-transaminase [Balneolales bacterium]
MNRTLSPDQVHKVLSRYMLTDGYDLILDLEKSETPYIYDSKNDKHFLDFFTFFASNPLGMNHPKITEDEKFREKMNLVAIHNPSNSDIYTKEMAELVNTFSRIGIPKEMEHLFFIAGGGLAIENALKVAFDWKVQKNFQKGYREEKGHKVLHFDQAFHGRTGYTMSLTNTEVAKVAYFPKFDWPRILNPKITFPENEDNTNDTIKREKLAIAQAERYFEIFKDDIAAIIIEPIQGEGGDNHFRPEFHKELRRLADEYEALLIHDEVQTGVGLTGKFWCHEHYVQPDILVFGKKSQVCGLLSNSRVDELDTNVFKVPSRINSTWGGNLVDMVRFQRILEVIEEDNLVENAASTGKHLLNRLEQLTASYEHLHSPRGKGLMCAFDFTNADDRSKFLAKSYDNGLLILPCGSHSIRFRPPLSVSSDQIDEGMEIIENSLKQTWQSNGNH